MSFATGGELRAWTLRTKYGERRRAEIERRIREQYVVLTPTNAVVEVYGQLMPGSPVGCPNAGKATCAGRHGVA